MSNESLDEDPGVLGRWRKSRYFVFSIIILALLLTAATGATVTLLSQSLPKGPAPAVPIVHVNSLCNSTSNPLDQQPNGSGVFTNTTGTFVTSGTAVAIRYFCTVSGTGAGNPAFSVVQEDPLSFASATPTITGLATGSLYVEATNISCSIPVSSSGIAIASATPITLGTGDYLYCLAINSYTSQVQPFSVTWST